MTANIRHKWRTKHICQPKIILERLFSQVFKEKGLRLLFSKLIYVVVCQMLTLREEESKNVISVRQVTGRFTDVRFPPNDNNNSRKLFPWKITTTQCGLERFFQYSRLNNKINMSNTENSPGEQEVRGSSRPNASEFPRFLDPISFYSFLP